MRAFILIPIEDPLRCIGDINGDGVVDIFDLLEVLANWAACPVPNCCPADITGDGVVDILDLLDVLANWGPCTANSTGSSIPSREERTTAVGITEERWDEFLDVLTNGSTLESERWRCWFERRITQCQTCRPCRGSDPFAN